MTRAEIKFMAAVVIGMLEAMGTAIIRVGPERLNLPPSTVEWVGVAMGGLGVLALVLPALPLGPSQAVQEPGTLATTAAHIEHSRTLGYWAVAVVSICFLAAVVIIPALLSQP